MSWKDKVNHTGSSQDYPKLEVLTRLTPKTVGNAQFLQYVKKNETTGELEKKYLPEIEGIVIGSYMIYSVFSVAENKSYKTTPFFDKKNKVKIFTTKKGDKIDFSGTAEEAQEKMFLMAKSSVKMTSVLVILRERGFITIETNMSLGIAVMNRVKSRLKEFIVSIKPKLFKEEDFKSDNLPNQFLRFASTNIPTYADISLTNKEIDKSVEESFNIEAQVDKYNEYKKFVISGIAASVESHEERDVLADEQVPSSIPAESSYNFTNQAPKQNSNAGAIVVGEDDLPF